MEAKRYNKGKLDVSQVPSEAVEWIAEVLQANDLAFGGKYEKGNWRLPDSLTSRMNSLERHYLDFKRGLDIDPTDGLPLVNKILTNALLVAWNYHFYKDRDDRCKVGLEHCELSNDEKGRCPCCGNSNVDSEGYTYTICEDCEFSNNEKVIKSHLCYHCRTPITTEMWVKQLTCDKCNTGDFELKNLTPDSKNDNLELSSDRSNPEMDNTLKGGFF